MKSVAALFVLVAMVGLMAQKAEAKKTRFTIRILSTESGNSFDESFDVPGKKKTILEGLFIAAAADSTFDFSGTFGSTAGYTITTINSLAADDTSSWEISIDGTAFTGAIEDFKPAKGSTVLFEYLIEI